MFWLVAYDKPRPHNTHRVALVRLLSPNHPNQSPIVTLKCDKTELYLPRGEFDFESRRWDISINQTIEICSEMTVTGVPIVLNGCSVADLSAPIFRKRFVSTVFPVFLLACLRFLKSLLPEMNMIGCCCCGFSPDRKHMIRCSNCLGYQQYRRTQCQLKVTVTNCVLTNVMGALQFTSTTRTCLFLMTR